jgi:hypothetical protein
MHWMLRLGVEREVNSLPWRVPRPGAHVVRAALFYLFNGLDTGPCCPMSINYAARDRRPRPRRLGHSSTALGTDAGVKPCWARRTPRTSPGVSRMG